MSDPASPGYDPGSADYDATYDRSSGLYIDRKGTSDSSADLHDQAEQQVDQDIRDAPWWPGVWKRFTRNSDVQDRYAKEMSAQARQLAAGLDTRQPPGLASTNYQSFAHSKLKPMVTEDVDPDQVGQIGQQYLDAGNAMTQFQSEVATAINDSQAEWRGAAGDSARRFMADVGNWVGTAGQSAQLAGTQAGIQSAALADAKNSMPDEVPFDAKAATKDLMSTTDPVDLVRKSAMYMNDYRESQAAHAEAARVVSGYDGHLSGASTMPAFAAPPAMGDAAKETGDPGDNSKGVDKPGGKSVNVTGGSHSNTSSGFGGPNSSNSHTGTTAPTGNSTSHPGSGSNNGNPGSTTPTGPTIPGGDSGTDPGNYLPGDPGYPGPGSGFPSPGGSNSGGQNQNLPGGLAPMPGGGPITGGEDVLRGGSGGGGGGRGGFGSGTGGGFGGGNSTGGGGGTGGGTGALSGRGLGAGMGAGAGALAAEQAAFGRGGAAGAGGRGSSGMGGMGGGGSRGQGGEDEEHQRPSYLVEADPDDVFGTDEMTAPPVIGG
ncbi:hypothetical protein [Actinokineospora inagensis]|uniref:hypothetical protein n=1 Tax=Actinokineospora inagensis TaxID=103730 RepID=UPI0012F7AF17|nr:hypothetical protein [Actinokineospora inagensis]